MADAKKKSDPLMFIVALPLFAAYGTWIVGVAIFRLVRWVCWSVRLMRPQLVCPSCGTPNSLYGRWQCQAPGCGAVYLGAADRCLRCHSGASFFPCRECRVSIMLRPGR
jgi:hypothetical protein